MNSAAYSRRQAAIRKPEQPEKKLVLVRTPNSDPRCKGCVCPPIFTCDDDQLMRCHGHRPEGWGP